ncbi:MAG: DUF2914 domain-containing protein [Candidatus Zixiibacteriota bacterium]|nr:MAG: DUF2914 domain-containing protein [candidate division Zixibacteria bacterium]
MTSRIVTVGLLVVVFSAASCLAQPATAAGPFTEVETAVCAGVEDRQPVGEAESFGADVGQVFFWTKCVGAVDTTVIQHVWTREGETMATVDLPVRSSSWRTWSSKQILPSWTGDWEVRVLDADGNILKAVSFKIAPAAPQAEQEEIPAEEPAEEPEEELGEEIEEEVDTAEAPPDSI